MPFAGGREPKETVYSQSSIPLSWSAWGVESDSCIFHTHFWAEKMLNLKYYCNKDREIKAGRQETLSDTSILCALCLLLSGFEPTWTDTQDRERKRSHCCAHAQLLYFWLHFYTGAGGICVLCTFLGSKYTIHFIQAATTLKYWCAPISVLVILGESPFCFGLCFCFSWSCMTLHSFSKDKITDYALWRLRGLVHGDTVVLLMDKKGDFCELNLHTKWMYITVFKLQIAWLGL